MPLRRLLPAVLAVLRHPGLWITALRQLRRLVPARWWARRPHLPVPDAAYLRFRMETAYGGAGDQPPSPQDLITYLRWCRTFPRL